MGWCPQRPAFANLSRDRRRPCWLHNSYCDNELRSTHANLSEPRPTSSNLSQSQLISANLSQWALSASEGATGAARRHPDTNRVCRSSAKATLSEFGVRKKPAVNIDRRQAFVSSRALSPLTTVFSRACQFRKTGVRITFPLPVAVAFWNVAPASN